MILSLVMISVNSDPLYWEEDAENQEIGEEAEEQEEENQRSWSSFSQATRNQLHTKKQAQPTKSTDYSCQNHNHHRDHTINLT